MIDSMGGAHKVNNFLTTLNLPPIANKNLKKMERRAGPHIENVADQAERDAAKATFQAEQK